MPVETGKGSFCRSPRRSVRDNHTWGRVIEGAGAGAGTEAGTRAGEWVHDQEHEQEEQEQEQEGILLVYRLKDLVPQAP